MSSFIGSAVCAPTRMAVASRCNTAVRAASVAAPVSVDVKKLDGSSAGSASVSLRVADASTATGVVHRYLTLVRQNLRQVRRLLGRPRGAGTTQPPLDQLPFIRRLDTSRYRYWVALCIACFWIIYWLV